MAVWLRRVSLLWRRVLLLVVVVVGVVALLLLRLTSPEVGLGVATAPAPDEEAGEYGKEEEETDPENDPADNHVPFKAVC